MQNHALPSMAVILPPADVLLSVGMWCRVLAHTVGRTSSIEWQMRLRRAIAETTGPTPRFDSGIPAPCAGAWRQLGEPDSWLSGTDVASWLVGFGYSVTHSEHCELPEEEPPAMTAPAGDRAWPLSSPEVAQAFAGVRGWDQKRWSKELGAPPDWLLAARIEEGQRGVRVATWDPVLIASALVSRGEARPRTVRACFQKSPLLTAWLPAWTDCEAVNFPGK
jgi:hypothetical protein